jgi:hypothetical protein
MLLSFLADILAVDSLIRLWSNPLPFLWWQILVLLLGEFVVSALARGAIRRSGRKSSSSRNLTLLSISSRLGLVGLSLASMLP